MANTYLTRTFGTPTNNLKWTFSAWIKRSNVTTTQNIFSARIDGSNFGMISINSSGYLDVASYIGGFEMRYITSRKFRDVSAFYHLCITNNSSLASPETKIYVNGVLETSFGTSNAASQNEESMINKSGVAHWVGQNGNNQSYFDGSMSHIHFCDGTALAPTVFGSTDSTTGEWKINTSPSFTLGNNGFTILKDGNTITDQSTNSNDFSLGGGTLTKTESSPSNVFATMNPLLGVGSSATYSNGNLTAVIASSKSNASTLGAGAGKFYFETKINTVGSTYLGFCSERNTGTNFSSWRPLTESALVNQTGSVYNGAGNTGIDSLPDIVNNDIIGCALDVDNKKFWWSKNGQWYSANASSSSTINISDVESGNSSYDFSSWSGQFVFASFGTSTNANNISVNFGNGYFGTTTVSSAGTNASGIGIFEYDVPTGYTALSTKGLNL